LKNQLRKDLLEAVRTYRAYVIVGAFVVFGIISPVLMKVLPKILPESEEFQVIVGDTTALSAATQYFDNITQIITLIIVLLAVGITAGKRNSRFFEILFTKPIKRRAVIESGFISYTVLILVGLVLGHTCFVIYTELLFGGLHFWGVLESFIACAACLCMLLALTIFMGVVTKRAVLSGVLSLVLYFVVSLLLGLLPLPWELGPTALFSRSSEAVVGAAGLAELLPGILFLSVLAAVLLYVSMLLFERADL